MNKSIYLNGNARPHTTCPHLKFMIKTPTSRNGKSSNRIHTPSASYPFPQPSTEIDVFIYDHMLFGTLPYSITQSYTLLSSHPDRSPSILTHKPHNTQPFPP